MADWPVESNAPAELRSSGLLDEAVLRRHLKSCGRWVKVYAGCLLVPPEAISLGDFSQVDEGVRVFAGEGVVIGCHVHLAFGSSISGGGRCELGDFVGIGAGARLITGTEVVDGQGLTNPTIPAPRRQVQRGCIRVGAHAVVFTNAVVLPDVTIGEGAIVAAGGMVHRDLKPWGIYAGHPLVQVGVREKETVLEMGRRLLAEEKERS
jgi:galactoside O-acetyltransferase